ncbi:PucR family transcriptional regulator [Streptomyces sp. LZ34]
MMKDIFKILESQVEENARKAVESYATALPEYRAARGDGRLYTAMLDFAVFIRRRAIDLAQENHPLSDDDISFITSIGQHRGVKRFSMTSQQNVLTLHTSLMLREISEAPSSHDMEGLLRMVNWFSSQAGVARGAYVLGYEEGRSRVWSVVARVQLCARKLLADEPAAPKLARDLDLPVPNRYAVTVLRIPVPPPLSRNESRSATVESLLARHRVPMLWQRPEEFVALVPVDDTDPDGADRRVLSLSQDVAAAIERPCAVGTATGRVSALAKTAETARLVSEAAPVMAVPQHAYTTADVFLELGLAQQPRLDGWLRDLTRRLADGPDLVATLDAYYRADMNRLRTAASLHVHPRTLDYRLRRVSDLIGVDPNTTRGVRLLSTAVARMRAGAWD